MEKDSTSAAIEKQVGFGTHSGKQIYQQVLSWGGMLGGGYIGILVGKRFADPAGLPLTTQAKWERIPLLSKLPSLKEVPSNSAFKWGGGIGLVVGMLTSGIVLGYEHWKKIRQAQLQVDEITRDVSDIEVFKKPDPELKAENERLWSELHAKKEQAPAGHKAWKDAVHHDNSEQQAISH